MGLRGQIQLLQHKAEGVGVRRQLRRHRPGGGAVCLPEHRGGQVLHGDGVVAGVEEVLHHVPQLPDIAGPGIGFEKLPDLGGEAEAAAQLPLKLLHHQKQVISPLRQGRDGHRQGVEPVVQVPAEGALFHPALQVLVGGGHDPHVDGDDAGAAHPHDLPLLEDPQQLHLEGGAHALHLVQKQRAPVGDLHQAQPAALFGAGEGPLLVAEELALQQVLRKGRHVDGHEGAVLPAGGPMDRVGEQLLAGAGLAHQQDGALAGGHPPEDLLGVPDGLRRADHILKAVFGPVALPQQLSPQLALAGLHLVEPLEDGKGADTGALAHHRHHLHADVDAVEPGDLGGQPLPFLEALGEGDVGEHLGGGLAHHQVRAGAGDLLGVAVAGEDLPLLIDAHHAVLQRLH